MEQLQLFRNTLMKLWNSKERAWFVSFRSPLDILAENPSFLLLEIIIYVWAFLLYKHGKLPQIPMWRLSLPLHAFGFLIYACTQYEPHPLLWERVWYITIQWFVLAPRK
jgi:hypothetical protein